MKYFYLCFFTMIILLTSMDSRAYQIINHFYATQSQAQTACVSFQNAAADGLYYIRNCYEYSTRGVVGNSEVRHYWMTNDNRPCPSYTHPETGACTDTPPIVNCSATATGPTCICPDGKPKHSGQYTVCERPNLVFCEFLGRDVPAKDCPDFEFPDDECPTDSKFEGGQCVNKCGINAAWDAILNKCIDNQGNETDENTCPRGYVKNVDGYCIPTSCPITKKLVDGVCVLDTDPKIDTKTSTVTNPDGSTQTTTITTTTIHNENGTTSTTINTTVTDKDSDGNVTNTDSKTEGKEQNTQDKIDEEEAEQENEVSGGSDCNAPPACSGDAIGCALVNQQWKTACLEADDEVTDITNCTQAFSCAGSILQCESLRLKNHTFCNQTVSAVNAFTQTADYKNHFNSATDLDENGILKTLGGQEIDLFEGTGVKESIDGLLNITGKSGSCPEDRIISFYSKSLPYSYGPVCTLAELSSPFFIFFVFIRRARALLKVVTDR